MNNENGSYILQRATDRLIEADAKLTAAMRDVVFGPDPKRVRINKNDLCGAIGLALLVISALILVAAFGG